MGKRLVAMAIHKRGRASGRKFYVANCAEITDDIPPLMAHILRRQCGNPGELPVFEPDAAAALMQYSWPGNVKEMENVFKQLAGAGRITRDLLPLRIANSAGTDSTGVNIHLGRGEYWARWLKAFLSEQLRQFPS